MNDICSTEFGIDTIVDYIKEHGVHESVYEINKKPNKNSITIYNNLDVL